MSVDVLILNTAVMDFRSEEFAFVSKLAGPGGLAKCDAAQMPDYTPEQYRRWIAEGCAAAGGPGNVAPLMARAGLTVAVGCNLGKGAEDGLDVQGSAFMETLVSNGVDMSEVHVHPTLPTGTTFIHVADKGERGGIGYFPNANDDFDFTRFKGAVERLQPRVVYYMYSGLSGRGDANGGRDLANFMRWCRERGAITIVDSHTLCRDPESVIASGEPVPEYRLLEPLLPELDIFFTSSDEVRMIMNTLVEPHDWAAFTQRENCVYALDLLRERFAPPEGRMRMLGVTVKDGAFVTHLTPQDTVAGPDRVSSRFMCGGVTDLVGAGDSFRAGLMAYVSRNTQAFADGTLSTAEAIQMGNLFATLYITAPLDDRYGRIACYDALLPVVHSGMEFESLDELLTLLAHEGER